MTVADARDEIKDIKETCRNILAIKDSSATKLSVPEMDYMTNAVVFLRQYVNVIEAAIDKAEVNL